VGQELLLPTANAADETGSWNVNADLVLRTPVDVTACRAEAARSRPEGAAPPPAR